MGRKFTATGSYEQGCPQKLGRAGGGSNIAGSAGSKTGDMSSGMGDYFLRDFFVGFAMEAFVAARVLAVASLKRSNGVFGIVMVGTIPASAWEVYIDSLFRTCQDSIRHAASDWWR